MKTAIVAALVIVQTIITQTLTQSATSKRENSNSTYIKIRETYKTADFEFVPELKELINNEECLKPHIETLGNMASNLQEAVAKDIIESKKTNSNYCISNEILQYFTLKFHESFTEKIIVSSLESITNLSVTENEGIEVLSDEESVLSVKNNTQLIKDHFSNGKRSNPNHSHNFFLYYNKVYAPNSVYNVKQDITNKISTLFVNQKNNQNNKKYDSTILFLIGDQCSSTSPELIFHSDVHNETYTVKYSEILEHWRNYQNIYNYKIDEMPFFKKLLLVVDCPNSHLWVDECEKLNDWREISVVASSGTKKKVYNKNDYASVFLRNFLESNDLSHKRISEVDSDVKICGYSHGILNNFGIEAVPGSWKSNFHNLNDKSKYYRSYRNENGDIYFGEVSTDKPTEFNGLGKILYKNNSFYQGELRENKRHGKGVFLNQGHSLYEGSYVDDQIRGNGILYGWFPKLGIAIKEGHFIEDLEIEGISKVIIYSAGSVYIGPIKNNTLTGKGIMHLPHKGQYTGDFKDGHFHGKGKLIFKDDEIMFKGDFDHSLFSGKGYMIKKNKKFVGTFRNFTMEGEGEIIYKNKTKFQGEFMNGNRHGIGKLVDPDGSIKLKGKWDNDTMIEQYELDNIAAISYDDEVKPKENAPEEKEDL